MLILTVDQIDSILADFPILVAKASRTSFDGQGYMPLSKTSMVTMERSQAQLIISAVENAIRVLDRDCCQIISVRFGWHHNRDGELVVNSANSTLESLDILRELDAFHWSARTYYRRLKYIRECVRRNLEAILSGKKCKLPT